MFNIALEVLIKKEKKSKRNVDWGWIKLTLQRDCVDSKSKKSKKRKVILGQVTKYKVEVKNSITYIREKNLFTKQLYYKSNIKFLWLNLTNDVWKPYILLSENWEKLKTSINGGGYQLICWRTWQLGWQFFPSWFVDSMQSQSKPQKAFVENAKGWY